MKTERNILIAFLLNLGFAALELVVGLITGSIAILSDALHDVGDAAGIGVSWAMERKSKGRPDGSYTFGYGRWSVLGGGITTLILLVGSILVVCGALQRLVNPVPIHYDGMILFALLGAGVNLCAAFFTRQGGSLNQKAVNLHMLEDVLGWLVVLVGAIIMRFTDLAVLDPLMSIGVAVFILMSAIRNMADISQVLLEKAPQGLEREELEQRIAQTEGVLGAHHIHIWSLDGINHCATAHIVADRSDQHLKEQLRLEFARLGVGHVTLELETPEESCRLKTCDVAIASGHHHHHHHHHHYKSGGSLRRLFYTCGCKEAEKMVNWKHPKKTEAIV